MKICAPDCTCGRHLRVPVDELSYSGRHARVVKARGIAKEHDCELCGDPAKEWSRIHEFDGTDPSHYRPLCFRCHRVYDDIAGFSAEARRGKPAPPHIGEAVAESNRHRRGEKRPGHTAEAKEKMAAARRGKPGHKLSEEARRRISEAAKARWASSEFHEKASEGMKKAWEKRRDD